MTQKDINVVLLNYHNRLQRMYDKQNSMELRERRLTKEVSKIQDNFMAIKEACMEQQRDCKVQKVLRQRRHEMEERVAFEKLLAEELEDTRQRNLSMSEQLKQQRSQKRQISNELMDCIHTLKETTGIYLKQEALPARVQGVVARTGTNCDQWIPFDLGATDTEGFESLFQTLQNANVDVEKWRQLVSLAADFSTTESRSSTTPRKDDAKCIPIIEIDLTSPPNQV
ncbi:kinetochore protein Spc25 [Drosophila kikkawai]|uniref:Kinetochore protein Spc25 n=1 Tax=Drosophila kikkawai TaxID=30033 RepID=A0A6P4JP18_DROKI|nr:kinetochore protein Spc25 [Drosophila kikkawai]